MPFIFFSARRKSDTSENMNSHCHQCHCPARETRCFFTSLVQVWIISPTHIIYLPQEIPTPRSIQVEITAHKVTILLTGNRVFFKMSIFFASIAFQFVFIMTMAACASAQSTLLGFFAAGGGGSSSNTNFADVEFVALELGFVGGAVGELCSLERIGCEAIALGSVLAGSSFVFNSGNDHFDTVVEKLTDGVDEQLSTAVRLFDSSKNFLFASSSSNLESDRFGKPLTGAQIDFVKVVVNAFSVTERQCCGGGGLEYSADLIWELYGVFPPPVFDPTADVSGSCSIGDGTAVAAGATLDKNCLVGLGVTIGVGVEIGKNTAIGDRTRIGDNTAIEKNVVIGSDVTIEENVQIDKNTSVGDGTKIEKNTAIAKDVVIGSGVTIEEDVANRQEHVCGRWNEDREEHRHREGCCDWNGRDHSRGCDHW